jgi:Holliday junction resolvase RusA-like endonuclease
MITLPWKVMVADNERHALLKIKGRGRIGLTAKYRDALGAASLLAAAQWKRETIRGSVSLDVTLYEPDKRRRDVANYLKLIGDTLTRVAFVDDSQIDVVTVTRGAVDRFNPRAEIRVIGRAGVA